MWAERLLAIASWLCGDAARQTVFEPLVADWQREWRAAHGVLSSLRVIGRGAAAHTTSLLLSIDTREAVQRHATTIRWAAVAAYRSTAGFGRARSEALNNAGLRTEHCTRHAERSTAPEHGTGNADNYFLFGL